MRLTNSLFSKPLFMTEESCQEIAKYLDKRNITSLENLPELSSDDFESLSKSNKRGIGVDGVGVINIFGGLSTYKMPMESFCNITSYEAIIEQAMEFAADDSIKVIAMDVRSGGGMAHKAFELSEELKTIAADCEKELVCYVNESACSAAYIFSSVADKVFINPTASCGSIGVLIQTINDSKALEMQGYERVFITSTDGKVPYAEDGSFREEFIADLKEEVGVLYEDFINHVVKYRGMDYDTVRGTNAKVYSARKAKTLGLVDEIMTTKKFKEYLQDLVSSKGGMNISAAKTATTQPFAANTKTQEVKLMTDKVIAPEAPVVDTELATKLADMQAKMDAQAAQLAAFETKEKEAIKANLSAELNNSPFLAECKESLVDFFMSAEIGEESKALMNSVISAANASMSESAELAEAKLAEVELEAKGKVEAATKEIESVKAEAEAVKQEFATTKFSETSETKDVNVQLSHAEKLAQAIAAEKSKTSK